MENCNGVIYILTNPSFPQYVKIGYADDIDRRLAQLNRSECIPFAFRIYATYEVPSRLSDLKIHSIIDSLRSDLRSIDNFNGQKRVREFYAMSPEDAYSILEAMADIHDCRDKLKKYEMTVAEAVAEETATEIAIESRKRGNNFTFSDMQIPIGAILEFHTNPEIKCVVVDERRVEYQGETMYLTGLASKIMGKKAFAGPQYFKYKGAYLWDIEDRV